MQPDTTNKKIVKMMQSATYKDEDCRVTIGIDDVEGRIRVLSNQRSLTCPNCHRTVILKAGKIKAHHFAHWDETNLDCIDEFYEPDGPEHQAMKLACLKFLRLALPDAQSINIEVPIPETNQRADVLAVCADGQTRYAIEVQVSPLDSNEWDRRHNLYHDVGIIDIWLLGFSRLKAHELVRNSSWDIPPGSYEAATFRLRRGSWSSPEWPLAQNTKRIYYLNVSSFDNAAGTNANDSTLAENSSSSVELEQVNTNNNQTTPSLITFCRVSEKEAIRYIFPFDPKILRISPKVGLITPAWRHERSNFDVDFASRVILPYTF